MPQFDDLKLITVEAVKPSSLLVLKSVNLSTQSSMFFFSSVDEFIQSRLSLNSSRYDLFFSLFFTKYKAFKCSNKVVNGLTAT